ncbi:MAG: phosphoribosyltransferase family protein [Cyanobacteria bacterium P01_G01_bin.38]
MAESLETRFQDLIERAGAMQIGHFQLASGLHSSRFFRCIKLLEDPLAADFLFDAMAEQLSEALTGPIDMVLGANEAGSILAFETAKRLKAKVAIARQTDHKYHLIDGFTLTPQQQVLIVDDITTTGGTAKQLIKIVQSAGATPIGVGLIATKGLFEVDLACPTQVLLTLEGMDAIAPENCPLCQQGLPLSR